MTPNQMVALAGAGAAGAVAIVVVVVVAVRGCSSRDEAAPRAPAAPGAGVHLATEGMRAPGTRELRALGCSQAIVVDMQQLLGDAGSVREGEPRYMVTCDVAAGASAPTCERAAETYLRAAHGTDANVNVRVLRAGSVQPECSRVFAPNGADLGRN